MRKPRVENKYNLTISKIENLQLNDRTLVREPLFWRNEAIKAWCITDTTIRNTLDDLCSAYNSYWIAIYDKPTKRTFNGDKSHKEKLFHINLSKYGGLCRYEFEKFFQEKDIECEIDLQIQELFLEKINELIDKKILKLGE